MAEELGTKMKMIRAEEEEPEAGPLTPQEIAALPRDGELAIWGLFGEWWCVPVDQTPEEQAGLTRKCKAELGAGFAACPDEQIADRLYGGFPCPDAPTRRHVYFAEAQYSYRRAGLGDYDANDAGHRAECWKRLLEANADIVPPLDGPFTSDAPREAGCAA